VRIGLLTYALDRPLTGIGRYTLELARALAALEDGPDVVLLTAGGAGPLAKENVLRRVSLPGCRLLPGLLTLGNVVIPRAARRLGLDVVHDPTGVTPFLFGAGGARTVVTVHDVFAWSCPGTSTLLDTLIYRHWLPRLLPRVDAVITDSLVSKADVAHHLSIPTDKTHIVHEGVNAIFHPLAPDEAIKAGARHGLPEKYILFVGSVEKRKNLPGLLHAYACLQTIEGTPPLVVVGVRRWKEDKIVEILRELDLEGRVIFTGHVPNANLPALYSGADLFVFPSLYEGFGLPPLEAMACGTPLVCSNAASLPEVVGDAAIMVDPYDVEGLAEAMRRVLADADLQAELRAKGLARAKRFTWERAARETVAVYREVLGNEIGEGDCQVSYLSPRFSQNRQNSVNKL